MDYGKYKNARNASWQCILDYDIRKLPVKVSDIVKQSKNIRLFRDSDVNILKGHELGKTVYQNGFFDIVYRDTDSPPVCRFTIAHELGHIFLGHLLINTPAYRTFAVRDDNESAANVFARDLLAPACVLHELKISTDTGISKLCGITEKSASYRAKRIQMLEMRNAWYLHPLERQVYKQFEQFIKENRSLLP